MFGQATVPSSARLQVHQKDKIQFGDFDLKRKIANGEWMQLAESLVDRLYKNKDVVRILNCGVNDLAAKASKVVDIPESRDDRLLQATTIVITPEVTKRQLGVFTYCNVFETKMKERTDWVTNTLSLHFQVWRGCQ